MQKKTIPGISKVNCLLYKNILLLIAYTLIIMTVLTMYPCQFSIEHLFFMERVKNVIMKNGDFIKFIYSDQDCVMNNIYFQVPLIITGQDRSFHKTRLLYDPLNNLNISYIRQIYAIEKSILDYFSSNGKKPVYKISENMYHGNIHFMDTDTSYTNENIIHNKFIIKFSGIWENSTEYGITYKFIFTEDRNTPIGLLTWIPSDAH